MPGFKMSLKRDALYLNAADPGAVGRLLWKAFGWATTNFGAGLEARRAQAAYSSRYSVSAHFGPLRSVVLGLLVAWGAGAITVSPSSGCSTR